jgi:hypothetical protein
MCSQKQAAISSAINGKASEKRDEKDKDKIIDRCP